MAYMTDENGNYKRTVRCGHCYEKGHNKSSCPERKTMLRENIENYTKELAKDNFPDEWQKTNTQRYLRRSQEQLQKMESKGKNRSCSHCGETGHNRRSCVPRKDEANKLADQTIKLRKHMQKQMERIGLGPGALIAWPNHHETNAAGGHPSFLAMVEKVALDDVSHGHAIKDDVYRYYCPQVLTVRYITLVEQWGSRKEVATMRLPVEIMNVDGLDISHRTIEGAPYEIISPVDHVPTQAGAFDREEVLKRVYSQIDDR